jgi:hypothetical protein
LLAFLIAPLAYAGMRAGFAPISGSASPSARTLRSESESRAALGVSSAGDRRPIGGLLGAPAVADTDTVTISTLARTIALVGVPITLTNPSPTAAFASLGAPNDTSWRLGRWSASDSAYRDVAAGTLGPIGPGAGYWLVTQRARTVRLAGQEVARDTFRITLDSGPGLPGVRPGWNQLANPFRFPVPVAKLRVTRDTVSYALTDTGNVLTERSVRVWNASTGAYASASVLPPGAGFWLKRIGTGTIRLLVPPVADSGSLVATPLKPSGSSWAVAIVAHQGDRAAEPLVLGIAPDAGPGWSSLCASRPPPPPGRYLSLHVPRAAWGESSGDYVQDILSSEVTPSWDVVLSGAEAGEVRLAATALDLPSGARLVLSDPREGWVLELAPGGSVTLAATREARALRLEVLPPGGRVPAAPPDGRARVAPSPFSRTAGITLSLSRLGDLAVEVFDAQGRRLRRIERPSVEPGEHVIVWDGRDTQGRSMPPGIYLAHWRAGSTEGTTRMVKVE